MYKEHPSCRTSAGNTPIWRYLDFTKFVSMLEDKALFFSRSDLLGDKFEGAYSATSFNADIASLGPGGRLHHWDAETKERVRKDSQRLRLTMYLNCWHLNRGQSVAMWKLYLQSKEGVAVKSSISRLKAAVAAAPQEVHLGEVTYIDYDEEPISLLNAFNPFLHKRKAFGHEVELRALYWHDQNLGDVLEGKVQPPAGHKIHADLDALIDTIFVAPECAGWFRDLTEKLLRRYGLNKEVKNSGLDLDPVW